VPDEAEIREMPINLADPPETEAGSLLDQLANKRKEIEEAREVDLRIPGYDRQPPILYGRYRMMDSAEIGKIGVRVRTATKNRMERQELAFVDTIIAACQGFYVDLGDGQLQPLTLNGNHISGYTLELAEALKFGDEINPTDARTIVYGLFANPNAINDHGFRLMSWFTNVNMEVGEDLFGGNL
jgi:hypothetical protein